MTNKLKYFFALFATICINSFQAQDFKSDYMRLHESYGKLNKFYCEVKVAMYEKESNSKPDEIITSMIKKMDQNYWYSLGRLIMLMNDNCVLYVDQSSKEMTYAVRDIKKETKPFDQYAATIDTIVKRADSVIFKGIANNIKLYQVYSSKSIIERTELSIDQQTGLVNRIVYYYNKSKNPYSEKVIIEYLKMNITPDFTDSDFSEKKYALYSKKILKPLGTFSGYKTLVINQNDFK